VGARANGRGRSGAPGSRVEPAGTAELSRRLKALADPTRLAIVSCLLSAPESVCVCDLTCEFDLGQPTISHHLKRLRQAGLVRAQRRGTWVHYRADRAAIEGVRQALARL
jgi:ArsR family transcriptional regulator